MAAGSLQAISTLCGTFRTAQDRLEKLVKDDKSADPDVLVYAQIINSSSVLASHDLAHANLMVLLPYAGCPTCEGKTPDKCELCKGGGFLSEFHWKVCVSEDAKAMRQKAIDGLMNHLQP